MDKSHPLLLLTVTVAIGTAIVQRWKGIEKLSEAVLPMMVSADRAAHAASLSTMTEYHIKNGLSIKAIFLP